MTTPMNSNNEPTPDTASDVVLDAGLKRLRQTAAELPPEEAQAPSLWSAIATELDKPAQHYSEPCDDELLNAYIDNELSNTDPLEQRLAIDADLSQQVGDLLDTHQALQRYALRLQASATIDLTRQVMSALSDAPDEMLEAPTWPLAWLQVLSAAYDEQLSESDKVLYHWLVQQEPHAVEQAAYQFQEVSESLLRLGESTPMQHKLLSPVAITHLVDQALHEEDSEAAAPSLPVSSPQAGENRQAKQSVPVLATLLPFPVKRYWATTAAAVVVGVVGLSWLSSHWLQTPSPSTKSLKLSPSAISSIKPGQTTSSLAVEHRETPSAPRIQTSDVSITPVSSDDSMSNPTDTTMTVEDYIWEMNQEVNHDENVVLLFNIKST